MANILTAYFSHKGENYSNGKIVTLTKGNTEIVAEMIQKAVGGDLFEVETETPYATEYRACVQQSKQEMAEHARPKLKPCPESLDGYDVIFVGYPCWCGTMPMAMFSFLERYDLTDKRIFPFCTNEGSGMGRSEQDLHALCPGATLESGLSIHGSDAAASEAMVTSWAKQAL